MASIAIDNDFDIIVGVNGAIEKATQRAVLVRNRLRVIFTTNRGNVILHPALGLPVPEMIRSQSAEYIQGVIERAARELEGGISAMDFSDVDFDPAIGELDMTAIVTLDDGTTLTGAVTL